MEDKPSEGAVFLVYNQKQYLRAYHPEYNKLPYWIPSRLWVVSIEMNEN